MEETILYFVSDDEPEATGKEQLTGRAKPFPAYEPDVVGVPEPTDEMYAWSWRWTDHKQSGRFCPDTPKDALIDFRCHHAVHPISEKPRRVRSRFVRKGGVVHFKNPVSWCEHPAPYVRVLHVRAWPMALVGAIAATMGARSIFMAKR